MPEQIQDHLKDLYNEFNPKLNLAKTYDEFKATMSDAKNRQAFFNEFNPSLKLAKDYTEFENVIGVEKKNRVGATSSGILPIYANGGVNTSQLKLQSQSLLPDGTKWHDSGEDWVYKKGKWVNVYAQDGLSKVGDVASDDISKLFSEGALKELRQKNKPVATSQSQLPLVDTKELLGTAIKRGQEVGGNMKNVVPSYETPNNVSESTSNTDANRRRDLVEKVIPLANVEKAKSDLAVKEFSKKRLRASNIPEQDDYLSTEETTVRRRIADGDLGFYKNNKGEFEIKRTDGYGAGLVKTLTAPFETFINTVNATEDRNISNNYLASLTKNKAIEYLNLKIANPEAFDKSPESVPQNNMVGIGAKFLGENINLLLKGTVGAIAGTALAPETGGASFGQFLTTVKDVTNGSYASALESNYRKAKEQNPNLTDEEAYDMAEKTALVSGATALATNAALAGSISGKLPTPKVPVSGVVNGVKASLKHAIKTSPKSVGLAAGGSLATDATANLVGIDVPLGEAVENASEHAKGMAIMHFGMWGLTEPTKIPSYIRPQIENVVASAPREEVAKIYSDAENQGVLPQGTTEKILGKLSEFDKAKAIVAPFAISEESKAAIAGKLLQKKPIEEELSALDKKAFPTKAAELEAQIEDINKDIDGIYKTNKPLSFEVDKQTGDKPTDKPLEDLQSTTVIMPKSVEEVNAPNESEQKSKPKYIIQPTKPISEMSSEDLFDYAKETKKALRKQDLEFENKTEAEKEDAGYYDIIDNVEDLRDASTRVSHIENAENLSELSSSVKSVLSNIKSEAPSDYSLAMLNAAKKRAIELNIPAEDLIKQIAKDVANQYKDIDEAEIAVQKYMSKILPKGGLSKEQIKLQAPNSLEAVVGDSNIKSRLKSTSGSEGVQEGSDIAGMKGNKQNETVKQEAAANELNKEAGIDFYVARQDIEANGSKYTLSQIKENGNTNTFLIEDANGNEIGKAQLSADGNYLENIRIDEKHRRKGLASKIYDFIELRKGIELEPSPNKQSKEAKALWDNRNLKKSVSNKANGGLLAKALGEAMSKTFADFKNKQQVLLELENKYFEQKGVSKEDFNKLNESEKAEIIKDAIKWKNDNPELVKAVEQSLKETTEAETKNDGGNSKVGVNNIKNKQLEIINKENPAPNNTNLWVRKVEDIKTADEVFSRAKEEGAMYPDFTEQDMSDALNKGEVAVYSSYPIKNGVFVSPSKMNAQEYAGGKNGKVYSKVVKLEDVAWLDEGDGQYAKVEQSIKEESKAGSVGVGGEVENVYYHGTAANFDKFEPNKTKSGAISINGAIFFSSNKKIAKVFADQAVQSGLSGEVFRVARENGINLNDFVKNENYKQEGELSPKVQTSISNLFKQYGIDKKITTTNELGAEYLRLRNKGEGVVKEITIKPTAKIKVITGVKDWKGVLQKYNGTTTGELKNKYKEYDVLIFKDIKDYPLMRNADEFGANDNIVVLNKDVIVSKEQSIKEESKAETPLVKETEQQVEAFGVPKEDVKATVGLLEQVFNGLKKAGITTAKTVGEWVGIGKGSEKPYSLKIDGKDVQVKNVSLEVVNGFYSPLEKTLLETKFDKLPAKQWIEKFARGEEAKWTGLTDWLGQQQGSVSKADIQNYLKENRIQIVEVVKGEGSGEKMTQWRIIDNNGNAMGAGYDTKAEAEADVLDLFPNRNFSVEERDTAGRGGDMTRPLLNPTKFQSYQLEGEKENYKEVLVTLPNKKGKSTDAGKKMVAFRSEMDAKYGGGARSKMSESETKKLKDLIELAREEGAFTEKDKFKSSHFDEPNILVHLRMNTRISSDGSKILMLEEIQSDFGQSYKKEQGSKNAIIYDIAKDIYNGKKRGDKTQFESAVKKAKDKGISGKEVSDALSEYGDFTKPRPKEIPDAPFITDTNAWTKLGLKVALKEAIAQGATKIAWTTGEQQNKRYDLSKQVDKIDVEAVEDVDGLFFVDMKLSNGTTENLEVENGIIREGNYKGQRLDNVIGKDYADKILSTPKGESKTLQGADLKVGGKGMKGFYGNPTDGSIGIVGGVAEKLFGQKVGTVDIQTEKQIENNNYENNLAIATKENKTYRLFYDSPNRQYIAEWYDKQLDEGIDIVDIGEHNTESEAIDAFKKKFPNAETIGNYAKKQLSTQHSIDITPEMKAEVEGKGQPLFKEAEAQYRIESGKNIIEAIKDFNKSKNKARATVALTHEIMHPTVVSIIDGAKEGNTTGVRHANTIVEEFNKVVKEKNKQLKLTQDAAENEHANSKLSKEDNIEQEPSIKAIEIKAESNNKAELNEVIKQVDAKINSATDVKTVPLKFISTDEARFQNRATLNKDIVKDISENWSDANQDPIHVWTDPKNGKTYVLSGHHRYYGAKEAGRENVKIVDRTNDFTEAEAIKFAKEEANANRSMETSLERAKALRDKIKRGDSKEEVNKFLEREGKNKTFVQNVAALNPKGKAIQMLEQFSNAGDRQTQKETEQRADWIGEARRTINGLTDAHENEMFDFIFDKDASKRVTNKADFLQKVRSVVKPLEPNEPLNIARFKQKTTGEAAYGETVNNKKAELSDRQEKINAINDRFSNPQNKDYISTDSKDYASARKIADEKISQLESERKLLQKQLEDIYRNKGAYTGAATSGTLFKGRSEILFEKEITVEDVIKWNDDFKNGKTNDQYRAVQEFIAESWEQYHTEGGKGFSESFQKVLDQITKAFQSVYKSITGKELTPELKQMFDEILGKEEADKLKKDFGKEPPKPPIEEAKADVYSEYPAFNMKHSELERVRGQFGLGEVGKEKVSNLDAAKNAADTITKWREKDEYESNINKVINDGLEGKGTDREQNILAQHIVDVRDALSTMDRYSEKYDKLSAELDRATEAGKKMRSEFARGLGRHDLQFKSNSIDSILDIESMLKEDSGVEVLTEQQKKQAEALYEPIKKTTEEAAKYSKEAEEEIQRLKAENELLRRKNKSKGGVKKTKEQYKTEREALVKNIKDKWKNAGKDMLSSDIPYRKQLVAIAPDVAKLIASYVDEAANITLAEVKKRLKKDIEEAGIPILEEDVSALVAGQFSDKKTTRSELYQKLNDLKTEERLLRKIDELQKGGKDISEAKKVERNQKFKELKDKIRELSKKEDVEISEDDIIDKKIEDKIKRNKAKQTEYETKLQNGDFGRGVIAERIFDAELLKERNPKLYERYAKSLVEKNNAYAALETARIGIQRKNLTKLQKAGDYAKVVAATSQGTVAMFDQSVFLVQMMPYTFAHPINAVRYAANALRYDALSAKYFNQQMAVLHNSLLGDIASKSGLAIYEPRSIKLELRAEQFGGDRNLWNREFTIKGKKYSIGQAFERTTVSMLNAARLDLFVGRAEKLYEEGKTFESNPEEFKAAARVANELTGHGKVAPMVEKILPQVTKVIWSPKMFSSTLNLLGFGDIIRPEGTLQEIGKVLGMKIKDTSAKKGYYSSLTPADRKFAAKEVGRFLATGVTIMLVTKALGGDNIDLDTDPRSSGFGSIKFKDSGNSFPVFGRFASVARTITQFLLGTKAYDNGNTSDLYNQKEGLKGGRFGVLYGSFIRGKETPLAGVISDLIFNKGYNYFTNEKLDAKTLAKQLVIPMGLQDIGKDIKEDGVALAAAQTLFKLYGGNIRKKTDFQKIQQQGKKMQREIRANKN